MKLIFWCEQIKNTKVTVSDSNGIISEFILTKGKWKAIDLPDIALDTLTLDFSIASKAENFDEENIFDFDYHLRPETPEEFAEYECIEDYLILPQMQYLYRTVLSNIKPETDLIPFVPEIYWENDQVVYFKPYDSQNSFRKNAEYIRNIDRLSIKTEIKGALKKGNINVIEILLIGLIIFVPCYFMINKISGIFHLTLNFITVCIGILLIFFPILSFIVLNYKLFSLARFLLKHENL